MKPVSRGIDRVCVTFDEPNLVANAGLVLVATLVKRLCLEVLIDHSVRLGRRAGGFMPGRKVLTLVHAMVAGASHIDHANVLRAGSTAKVLEHRVMAPSTLGTFLRAFTFGHVRQLEAVIGHTLKAAWSLGAGPGDERLGACRSDVRRPTFRPQRRCASSASTVITLLLRLRISPWAHPRVADIRPQCQSAVATSRLALRGPNLVYEARGSAGTPFMSFPDSPFHAGDSEQGGSPGSGARAVRGT